jgi:LytS/YehU family sensor histidine kinase
LVTTSIENESGIAREFPAIRKCGSDSTRWLDWMASIGRDAHLRALQMQLEPHFLFNALNAITSLVELDPR